MKKLFGRDKPKMAKVTSMSREHVLATSIDQDPHPIYTQHQARSNHPRTLERPQPAGRTSVDELAQSHAQPAGDWEMLPTHHQPSPNAARPPPLAHTESRSSSLGSPVPPSAYYAPGSHSNSHPNSPSAAHPRSPSPSAFSAASTSKQEERLRRKEEKRLLEEEARRIQEEEVRRRAPNPGSGRRAVGLLAALGPSSQSPSRGLSPNSNGYGSTYGGGSQYAPSEHPEVYQGTAVVMNGKDKEKEKEKKRFWERGTKEDKAKAKELAQEKEREKEQERSLQKEREKALQREREKERQRAKEREREREEREKRKEMERQERERSAHQEDHPADLTRMIGWLTATASEDWSLVLEVCERASSTPDNAREAIRALRKEFKYAEPPAQLSAARLLAIMLRNSSPTFLAHCSSRKFLDTLEDVLTSPRTNPVVRERLMDVLAGAAWMCSQELDNQVKEHPVGFWSEKDDFRSLWRRVRPADKPEQGIPFDTDDAMFNPPTPRRPSSFVQPPSHPPHDYTLEPYQPNADRPSVNNQTKPVQGHKPRNRIIPPDEDIRRLFQECKVGRGNAALLSEALAFAKPEDLKEKDVIKEFHHKCTASQEFIFAQIPWATATAERSRSNRGQVADGYERQSTADGQQTSITREEELLAELLFVNEELLAVLRVYDDLVRLGQERDAEERSRYDFRMDRAQLHREQQVNGYGLAPPSSTGAGSSRSPSPSLSSSPAFSSTIPPVIPSHAHPLPPIPVANANTNRAPAQVHGNTSPSMPFTYPHTLAPPHGPRHGPRSPMHRPARSRSPSLERPSVDSHTHSRTSSSLSGPPNGLGRLDVQGQSVYDGDSSSSEEVYTPMKPSEKALGKRRLEDPPTPERAQDEFFPGDPDDASQFEHYQEEARPSWSTPIHYVYDAAAERTEQRIRQGQAALVTGVR